MPTVVNTELTAGVGQKWVKPVEVSDVAEAIVGALEVPGASTSGSRNRTARYPDRGLMPRAAGEALARAMRTDKLMTEVDHGAGQVRGAGRAQRRRGRPVGGARGERRGHRAEAPAEDRAIN